MLTLNDLSVLKSLAKSYELIGYSKLRKNDLIEFINNHFKQKKHKN